MATKVAEKLTHCRKCEKTTLQRTNVTETKWLMHFILSLITAGIWFLIVVIPMLLFRILGKANSGDIFGRSRWVCSECGTENFKR